MVKKVIATALCLAMTTPCFAAGRFDVYHPNKDPHRMNPPRYEQRYDYRNDMHKPPRPECRSFQRTKTLAAVAGIAGVAMLISSIVD